MTLKQDQFEYRGINSATDLKLIVGHVSMPIAPTISESVNDIPMKYGNEFLGTAYGSKSIDIPITALPGGSYKRYMEIIENLTNVFVDNDPDDIGLEFPLVFGFRPEVTYYGHFTSIPTPTFISEGVFDFNATLTFVMSDPRGCLPQNEQTLKGSGANSISVPGTANSEPVIHIIPKHDLMYFGYSLNNGLFGVGPDSSEMLDQAVVSETDLVMADNASSMAMWTTDADAINTMTTNGDVKFSGSLDSDSTTNAIYVKKTSDTQRDFGSHYGGWYGPAARHQGLSQSLSNFKVNFRLEHKKYQGTHNGRAMGRVDAILLDQNGRTIGRFTIMDRGSGGAPVCHLSICRPGGRFEDGDGNHQDLYYGAQKSLGYKNSADKTVSILFQSQVTKKVVTKGKGKNAKTTVTTKKETVNKYRKVANKNETNVLSQFWGTVSIQKKGNVWTWSITQMDTKTGKAYTDKKKYLIVSGTWVDKNNKYTDLTLGSVGFYMAKHSISEDDAKPVVQYTTPYQSITDVKVWRVNEIDESKPKAVAHSGDEIIINTEQEKVTVEDKLVYPVWSTDWPRLKPGNNYLQFSGNVGDAKIVMEYVPRVK